MSVGRKLQTSSAQLSRRKVCTCASARTVESAGLCILIHGLGRERRLASHFAEGFLGTRRPD